MGKTIVILSHVTSSNSLYCDYVHSHAIALKNEGYNVIVFACINYFPFLSILLILYLLFLGIFLIVL